MSSSGSFITEIEGDLFKDAPDNSLLIHACNCQGSWGKGIAKAFREKYPEAFRIYRAHCQAYLSNPSNESANSPSKGVRTIRLPEGTARLIPPQEKDYKPAGATEEKKKQWIACLFTSWHYGPRNRSTPDVILANTELAVADLKRQLAEMKSNADKNANRQASFPGELWGCRFNAGLFAVEWERTRKVLEDAELSMTIVKLAGE